MQESNYVPLELTKALGFEVLLGVPDKDRVSVKLNITDLHLNRHKALHGGISSMLLDTVSGLAASYLVDGTSQVPFQTVSLNVSYINGAYDGEVTAVAYTVGGGRSLRFMNAELRSPDNKLIASSIGVFKRMKTKLQP